MKYTSFALTGLMYTYGYVFRYLARDHFKYLRKNKIRKVNDIKTARQ